MNENDQGIGNVLANRWTIQIFAKHLVILIMIILEIWVLFISLPKLIKTSRQLADNEDQAKAILDTKLLGMVRQNELASIALSFLGG
jgi:1,4-dihydroxy-2-naphthoate octaprenyltransferase